MGGIIKLKRNFILIELCNFIGFDIVIGNPPYLGGREWKEENGKSSFVKKYVVAEYQFDIYSIFWEAGINLLKDNGLIGYITPDTWLNNKSNKKLRTFILNTTTIKAIFDCSKINVFDKITVSPIITILENKKDKKSITEIFELFEVGFKNINSMNQSVWLDNDLNIININLSLSDLSLKEKIVTGTVHLEKLAQIKFGIKVYQTGKGNPKQTSDDAKNKIFESKKKLSNEYLPYLKGKDIDKYSYKWNGDWLHYGRHLAEPRTIELFECGRLLVRRIVGKTLIATYIQQDFVTGQLLQIVKPYKQEDDKFLLGILNSNLMAYYFRKKYNRQDKTFPEIRIYELSSLPIKIIDKSTKPLQEELTKLVEQILKLKEEIQGIKLQTQINQAQSKIKFYESEINKTVYLLYDLTLEEIKIVEEATKR